MNLLERYIREISLELDANTVKNYKSYLNTFFKFLKEEKTVENIDDIIYLLNKEKRYLVKCRRWKNAKQWFYKNGL